MHQGKITFRTLVIKRQKKSIYSNPNEGGMKEQMQSETLQE